MTDIVINACFGGFSLSEEAQKALGIRGAYPDNEDFDIESDNWDAYRADHRLVQTVRNLGPKANGGFAQLKIVTIPDGVDWTIKEYDGQEHIAEVHRTWR